MIVLASPNKLRNGYGGVYGCKLGVYGRNLLCDHSLHDFVALDQSHVIQTNFTSLRMDLGHHLAMTLEFTAQEPILGGLRP